MLFRALAYYFLLISVSYIFHRIGVPRTLNILSTLYAFVTSQNYVTTVLEDRLPNSEDIPEQNDQDVLTATSFPPEVISLVGRFNTDLLLVFSQLAFIWTLYGTSGLWFFPEGYTATSTGILWFLQHANLFFVVAFTLHHIFWDIIRLRSLTRVVLIWLTEVKPSFVTALPFVRSLSKSASLLRAGVISTYIFFVQQKDYPPLLHIAPLVVVIVALVWVFLSHFGILPSTSES